LWLAVTLLMGVICGTVVWAGEQTNGAYRFLGDQRIPLGRFWVVKTGVWSAVVAGGSALVLVGGIMGLLIGDSQRATPSTESGILGRLFETGPLIESDSLTNNRTLFLLLGPVYGYAVGQFLALLIRKPLAALVLAVLLSAILTSLWLPSVIWGGVPVWQVLLVPAILLVISRLVIRAWAAERLATWRPASVLAGGAVLAAAWVCGSVWCRGSEVPGV